MKLNTLTSFIVTTYICFNSVAQASAPQPGVRLENGKYPTLSLFFVQITSWVYGDS